MHCSLSNQNKEVEVFCQQQENALVLSHEVTVLELVLEYPDLDTQKSFNALQ